MKKGNIFLVTFSLLCLVFSSYGQENSEKKFIQFIFTNLEKPGQAKKIQDFIQQQEGVFMVRANYNSRKFFLIYYSESEITISKVEEWFEPYGIEYKCLHEGIHGIDTVINQNLDCE